MSSRDLFLSLTVNKAVPNSGDAVSPVSDPKKVFAHLFVSWEKGKSRAVRHAIHFYFALYHCCWEGFTLGICRVPVLHRDR